MLGIPYRSDGGSGCCVEVHGAFYKIAYPLSEEYVFVFLPFSSRGLLTGLHVKKECIRNQLAYGCVWMCVFLLVDVKHYLG